MNIKSTQHAHLFETSDFPPPIDDLEKLTTLFSGKLLLRKEIPIDEKQFQMLLSQSYFRPVQSFIRRLFTLKCRRCGNTKKSLLGKMPCSICGQTHHYCRKCIDMGRVLECEPFYVWSTHVSWKTHEAPCAWQGSLTEDQQQAAVRIQQAIDRQEEELLVCAVCGAGKTEMLFPGIAHALANGKRICVATPRTDVVQELHPRLQAAFPGVPIQALYGGSDEKTGTGQIILATTHQLLRFKGAFDVMIIDEVDAFPYHADKALPYATAGAKKAIHTTIYLTATPGRKHRRLAEQGKLAYVYVTKRFHGHPLPVPVLKICHRLRGDVDGNVVPQPFLKWLKARKNPDRQLLVFVPSIDNARNFPAALKRSVHVIHPGFTDDDVTSVDASDLSREEKIKLFREREIMVLVTTTILERGVTFPSVDVAVLNASHAVFDEAALVQIAGRAGRSAEDPEGEVVFFHDGKTEAMLAATHFIKDMNRQAGFSG